MGEVYVVPILEVATFRRHNPCVGDVPVKASAASGLKGCTDAACFLLLGDQERACFLFAHGH